MPKFAVSSLIPFMLAASTATAAPVYWNTWSSPSSGSLTYGGSTVSVVFSTTNFHTNVANYPSWSPAASFEDGVIVDNAPISANGIMRLTGGTQAINTVSFTSPVVDPAVAIWSLGTTSLQASFDFVNATPTLVAGGSSTEYGGSSISILGAAALGNEGNGTIQFTGTYTSLSWTNPVSEN